MQQKIRLQLEAAGTIAFTSDLEFQTDGSANVEETILMLEDNYPELAGLFYVDPEAPPATRRWTK